MQFLSPKAHTVIGLIVGIALLFAPNIFGFNDVGGAAVAIPRYLGVFVIINELITTSSLSLVKLVPMKAHIVIDFLSGLFLLLSPWLFGFADEAANAWVPHVLVGLLMMGYSMATRTSEVEGSSARA